jgi:6-phosphofructokinase 2
MKTILTLTMNPSVDISTTAERVVTEDKLRCQAPRYETGGGGINVSRVIRRLDGASKAFYTSGGGNGQMLQRMLDEEGLDHHPILISGPTRQNFTVLDESTNEEFRFVLPGPTLSEDEWQSCMDVLFAVEPRPEYIVASGSLPPGVPEDFYARIARRAKRDGVRVVVDASGESLRAAMGEGVYLIKPNVQELSSLTGRELETPAEQEAVAKEIVERGQSEVVVVSFGSEGALVASVEGCERLQPPDVPEQSAVGAGDSMVALIVLSLARGSSLQDAVRSGMAAGAATAMMPGTELCHPEDVEQLVEQVVEES